MKDKKRTPIYVLLFVLLAAALLLPACAETTTVSAEELPLAPIEEMLELEAATAENPPSGAAASAPVVAYTVGTPETAPAQGDPSNGDGPGTGAHIVPAGDLSSAEIEALQFMREEEKLARDVYQGLYETWGVPIFNNIAGSEQAHMDAIAYLLDAYGLDDPAAGKAVGEFNNQDLQALYEDLVAQGRQSQEEALLVGAAVEEIDILDLQERLAQTDNPAIKQVFENLLAGSQNHLRAFAANLERQTGTAYEPQYLDQAAYGAIMGTASGRGNGPGGSAGGGQGPGSSQGPGSGFGGGRGQGSGSRQGRSS